jgi:pimeloyl-ACP methyl ester carboxylesterase
LHFALRQRRRHLILVLLPGMDGTGTLFDPFLAVLPPHIQPRVIAYPPDSVLGYADLERHVRAALPVDEPFVLLAESFSGPLGIAIAAAPPPGLRGLILCCTFARNPRPRLAPLARIGDHLPLTALPSTAMSFFLFGPFGTPPLRAALARALASVRPVVLRSRLLAIAAIDVTPALRRVAVPMLYLRALNDRLVPRAAGDVIRSNAPAIGLREMAGPHALLQASPVASFEAMRAFLATIAS